MSRIFTMSQKSQLALVLKLHDLFWIMNDTYEDLKTKNSH